MPERIKGLDGLRALAVAAVILTHSWPHIFPRLGAYGVRLFFLLSGFLITGILARARIEADETGGSRGAIWRAFVMRRAIRIFPLAYLAMLIAYLAGLPDMRLGGWWFASYTYNLAYAFLPIQPRAWGLGHFWSLAVEEQFYLLWPGVILLLPRRWWVRVMAPLAIAGALSSFPTILLIGGDRALMATWTHIDVLVGGALLAVYRPPIRPVALLAVTLAALASVAEGPLQVVLIGKSVALGCVVLLLYVSAGGCRWLSWMPLAYLGTISYGIYIWHQLLAGIVIPGVHGWPALVVMGGGGTVAAALSWRFVEQPILRLKDRFAYLPTEHHHRTGVLRHRTVDAVELRDEQTLALAGREYPA